MGTRLLKIKALRKKLPIHPSFILFVLWFVVTRNIGLFFLFCCVVLTHELGHYIMAKKLGYKLKSFYLAPYGACLNYQEEFFEAKDEILIAMAGPVVNIFLSFITISLWWIFPAIYSYTYQFVVQSLILGLFNLLPCYPLDGGRIFVGILSRNQPRKKAIKITVILNIVFSIIFFICFILSCFYNFNPSICLCGIFLLLGVMDTKYESKYQLISLYKKKTKNFSKPFFLTVKDDVTLVQLLKHIEPNRYTVFILLREGKTIYLDEDKIKLLSLRHSLDTKISELLDKKG